MEECRPSLSDGPRGLGPRVPPKKIAKVIPPLLYAVFGLKRAIVPDGGRASLPCARLLVASWSDIDGHFGAKAGLDGHWPGDVNRR